MDRLSSVLNEAMGTNTDGVSNVVVLTMGIVVVLIAILSLFAIGVSVYLAISYIKYNRTKKRADLRGKWRIGISFLSDRQGICSQTI